MGFLPIYPRLWWALIDRKATVVQNHFCVVALWYFGAAGFGEATALSPLDICTMIWILYHGRRIVDLGKSSNLEEGYCEAVESEERCNIARDSKCEVRK